MIIENGRLLSQDFIQSYRTLSSLKNIQPKVKLGLAKLSVEMNKTLGNVRDTIGELGNDKEALQALLKETSNIKHEEKVPLSHVIDDLSASDIVILDGFLDEEA